MSAENVGLANRTLRTRTLAMALGVTVLVGGATANAAQIALYDFSTSTATSSSWPSLDTEANSTATDMTPAAGLGSTGNWNTTNNGISTTSGNPMPAFAIKPLGAATSTSAQAYTNNAYASFTITPGANHELDLTSFTFWTTSYNAGRRVSYYVASSIDGFDTPIASKENVATADKDQTILLAGAQFQNVDEAVTFRIYLWDVAGLGGASGSRWELDNITVNGDVVQVPEPASAMTAAGVAALGLLRRRRSR